MGDKHRPTELALAHGQWIINGAFVGTDEFSLRFPPAEASQLLFWLDPDEGKTFERLLKLESAPNLGELPYRFPDRLRRRIEQQ